MNWKNIASMALAAGAAATIIAISSAIKPLEPAYVQSAIAGIVAAVVHKINIWGGTGTNS